MNKRFGKPHKTYSATNARAREVFGASTKVVFTDRHRTVFERLEDEGIIVEDVLRYYPYRATFDFECYFDRDNVPVDSDRVQWIARHVPLRFNKI